MDCAVLELEMAQNKWFVMTQRAPQLRRSRWRLAILVLRGVDEKSAKRIKIKLRSLSPPVGLVRSSVSGSQIHKARVNTSGWASFAPVRRKPRSPLNRYMLLFFLHKMAAVLSAAWQPSGCVCVHGGTRRLCPSSFPLCTRARLAVLFLFRHPVVLVTGDEPCGLKKQTGLP